MSVDELLNAANQLSEPDLEQLTHQVLRLRAHRKAPILSDRETELFLCINRGVPDALHQEYQLLSAKSDDQLLAPQERERLLAVSDEIEVLAAERADALAKLADVRQVPLMQMMHDLGIRTPGYV
jgi:hypothetical protein